MSEERELTAHELVAPALRAMIAAVRANAQRLVASGTARSGPGRAPDDAEAVHDFRVALRTLRTVLRPLRKLYGKKRMRAIGAALKVYSDATGALRDEEVLRETIAELELPLRARSALADWTAGRRSLERARRRAVVRLLRAEGEASPRAGGDTAPRADAEAEVAQPSLEAALHRLERRLARLDRRVARGDKPISAAELARKAIDQGLAEIDEHAGARMTDALAMHLLRIRWKRLRYTAELFQPVLGEEGAAMVKVAAKLQKRLGELHDVDEALVRVPRARTLAPEAREPLMRALGAARRHAAKRAKAELDQALEGWPAPAARRRA